MGRRHGKPAGALSLSQLLEREGLVPGVLPAGFIATIPVEATFGEDLIVDPGDVVPVDKVRRRRTRERASGAGRQGRGRDG